MTRQEFIQRVAEQAGLTQADAARIVDAILAGIVEALRSGQAVTFTGFGKFHTTRRAARMGVNPRTGAPVHINMATVPKFSAGSQLKQAVGGRAAGQLGKGSGQARSRRLIRRSQNGGGGHPSVTDGRSAPDSTLARPPGRPGRLGSGSPTSEKRINAWISGRGARRTVPLHLRETYELNINVGAPRDASVVEGDAAIDSSSLPSEGLETEWILSAEGMELAPGPGEQEIEITPGSTNEPWTARFHLHIPKEGDSDTRVLAVTPRRATAGRIEVVVMVRGELYRRVGIVLSVAGAKGPHARRTGSTAVESDVIQTRALHTQLRTLHEWTTPPGRLAVIVQPPNVFVVGSAGGLEIDARTQWTAASALVNGPIKAVRAAAETFRASWEGYLNDIDPADVVQRLGSYPIAYWGSKPQWADARHERAWRAARKSPELRQLAYAGRVLYDTVFAPESDLRMWVDSLGQGHRLDISWRNLDPGWVPGVPWGLMYAGDPGKAVDPLAFLGLKLRIAYSSHVVPAGSKALGNPADVYCGNLLYWGSGQAGDATAEEAEWQRAEWSAWEKQLFWPTGRNTKDPKKELVRALARPKPTPVGVIYLYCQSSFGTNNQDPVLGFSDPIRTTTALTGMDLGIRPLGDRPLVFANACTTSAGDPYESNPLEDRFFQRGCRAFLGTEIRVPIQMASKFARVFFEFFYRKADPAPIAAGEAVAQTRLFLWHHYLNIGGLFYTYVNQYELFLADDAEVVAMRS